MAWIWIAIVHVEFTIWTLEPFRAFTTIRTNEVFTNGSILAWIRGAFVYVFLAVASFKAKSADTLVTISTILAMSTVLA